MILYYHIKYPVPKHYESVDDMRSYRSLYEGSGKVFIALICIGVGCTVGLAIAKSCGMDIGWDMVFSPLWGGVTLFDIVFAPLFAFIGYDSKKHGGLELYNLAVAITIVFAILDISGITNISWVLVTAPIWGLTAITMVWAPIIDKHA